MNLRLRLPSERESQIADWVARVTGSTVLDVTLCEGGRNNRVYRIRTADGDYAVKDYAVGEALDSLERLQREFHALRFLERIGFRAAPRALGQDPSSGLGLYEFVAGEHVIEHGEADIGAVAAMLKALHDHREDPESRTLPAASAAHFSAAELLSQIESRHAALAAQPDSALRSFLERKFMPEFERRRVDVRAAYAQHGLAPEAPLPHRDRSLSPSDFGFHNALRRPDKTIAFLDFEYFGWDDPVNATGNFLWHPGFVLSDEDRYAFATAAASIYNGDRLFGWRLRTLLPLYPLRWALIALNEFLPTNWERRRDAGAAHDRETAKGIQLEKAVALVAAAPEFQSL